MSLTRSSIAAVLFSSLIAAGVAPASDEPTPLQRAQQLVQGSDFEAAAPILEELVQAEPENGNAWLLLGRARSGLADYEAALEALEKAQASPATRSPALRETFLARAGMGDLDGAAAIRAEVWDSALVDLSGLHLRPELEKLSGDARFADLFPKSFESPFVEGESVIHDWRGEGRGHEFGWEARNVGDVDGDDVDDALSSAPGNQPGADASGLVYVFSGRSGELLWLDKGEPGDQLGLGIEAAGDVNGDGTPDVIAGAPGRDRAWVYSGDTGLPLLELAGDEDVAGSFGGAVSSAGDVDGDGCADVLVGAARAAEGAGRVYLFSGKTGARLATRDGEAGHAYGSVVAGGQAPGGSLIVVGAPGAGEGNKGRVFVYRDLTAEPAFVIEADETGQALGAMFVSVVGDVDADGMPDVYASDFANQAKGPFTGRIYVHSGRDGERLLTLTGEAPGDGFGIGPARAGDVDGDGHDDLVIGAWQHRSAAPSGGKVYVYSGRDGSLLETFTGRIGGETLGFDADGMGDVNGDGRYDYLVTSAWSLVRGVRSGRTLVVAGGVERKSE